ncbi:MAG: hypothetical protein R3F41_15730 [Gammaproteobacteria bacterium]|nr:hypothetical protein [Pseudomonadales bacterium]
MLRTAWRWARWRLQQACSLWARCLATCLVASCSFTLQAQQPIPAVTESTLPPGGLGFATEGQVWGDYFHPAREEALIAEARRARSESRFLDSELLLEQALQINRASAGLHNPSQLHILEATLESLLLQQKWSEFDEKLDYLAWLNRRINRADPLQLAEGLQHQSRWHRAAAAAEGNPSSAWYLIQGKYLDWQAVSLLEQQFGRDDSRLAPLLYQITLTHFYQTVSIERRGMASYEFRTDAKAIASGRAASRSETLRRSYRIGRELLSRIRSLYAADPSASGVTDALLQIQLADWDYLYGAVDRALDGYRQAYLKLLEEGIPGPEIDSYFNRLQPLPLEQLQTAWPDPVPEPSALSFDAWSRTYPGAQVPLEFQQQLFNDQAVGRIREGNQTAGEIQVMLTLGAPVGDPEGMHYGTNRIKPVAATMENDAEVERALTEIKLISFRPRLVGGEAAVLGPVLLRYRPASDRSGPLRE